MAGSITIKADPAALQAKAQTLSSRVREVERKLNAIREQVGAAENYWKGDASGMHRQKFKSLEGEINTVMKGLKAHPKDLLSMAGLYKSTELAAQEEAGVLLTDVIT